MENINFNMDKFPVAIPPTKGFGQSKWYVKEGNDMLYVARGIGFAEIK